MRPRAKRLLCSPDGEETRENQSSPSNRSRVLRTLQFSSNNASTTCASSLYSSSASYSSSQLLLAGVNPMSYVHGVLSPIPQIGPNYCVFPHVETHQDFRPSLTMTPSCSTADPKENTQVRLSVQYPSKKLNRRLSETYQNIGKAVAHGVPSRIATAVMNCLPVRDHVVEKVMKAVSQEVTGLASRQTRRFLENRKIGSCKVWFGKCFQRMALFYSFLLMSAANKNTKSCLWLGSVSLARSVLLKQRNREIVKWVPLVKLWVFFSRCKAVKVWLWIFRTSFSAYYHCLQKKSCPGSPGVLLV